MKRCADWLDSFRRAVLTSTPATDEIMLSGLQQVFTFLSLTKVSQSVRPPSITQLTHVQQGQTVVTATLARLAHQYSRHPHTLLESPFTTWEAGLDRHWYGVSGIGRYSVYYWCWCHALTHARSCEWQHYAGRRIIS